MKKNCLKFAIMLFSLAFITPAFAGDAIVIKGSTTVLPIAQATIERYTKLNKGVNISLSGGGSGDGIKALIDGITNIADSSRPLSDNEMALAKTKGVKPVAHIIALDALSPVVHPSNR
ncbi:MAG: substrate-binding domain-containing protein, partial [Deltaproteobacteria bacterium]